ncbi:response regulator [Natronosporangium hydrolyticum]|uniref:Sensor-like histidine kinase SenX3 n=1 Tax=Natronosporangium hydrolyticum TaxID=2811111 RepID=A0A895YF17_9ACTN|nr:ATP-binding protein [Natronosporangium hydrolyticum]QSB16454.1 response regulator [Natronosporangium hydrolyticum]
MSRLQVLILEDNPDDAQALVLELRRAGIECNWTRVDTFDAFQAGLAHRPDIILSDFALPGLDALDALTMLDDSDLDIPLIVVSEVMNEEACVECLRRGAIDYLLKDRLSRLGPAVEHALAEQQLRASRRRAGRAERRATLLLNGVVDNAPSAIYAKDGAGRYVIANGRMEQLLGVAEGTALGRTDRELVAAPLADRLTALNQVRPDRPAEGRPEEFGHGADRRIYLSVRYPIRLENDDGDPGEAVGGILTDITEQKKRVEAELRTARAKLRDQAADLERDILDFRELNEMKAKFIEAVSHELRSPLSLINGTIETLVEDSEGSLGPEEQQLLATMSRAGSRLQATIMDLLTVFQIDRGGFNVTLRPVRLAEVVYRALHTLQRVYEPLGHQLTIIVPDDLPLVTADRDQLGRALTDLVLNAIKFTPSGGSITVSTEATDGEVVVKVRDTGIGIPNSEQAKAFLRFRRGAAARQRASQGVGLGLAICKEIIDQHHGWIDLDSEEGRGTTVSFGLPRYGSPDRDESERG